MGNILITEEEIRNRVQELGRQISEDYRSAGDLLLVGVLRGTVVFFSDLLRTITVPASIDFMAISSYGQATQTSGVVRIIKDLDESIEGKNVLLVEDIIDTGLTLRYIMRVLQARKPASLKLCVLLNKDAHRLADIKMDYVGFSIPNIFVVGYGLDYNQLYRNLPYLALFDPQHEPDLRPGQAGVDRNDEGASSDSETKR